MKALILGAGETGRRLAGRLLDSGEDVILASRSGTEVPGARAVALDAADATAVGKAAKDVDTVFLVTNPPQYHRWAELWPPVVDAVVTASRGKDLVVMSNLYVYGRARMPMTEHSPLQPAESKGAVRLELWRRVLAAHDRGDLRAVEVRASDYFGPGAGATAMLGGRFFDPLLAGRTARVIGDPEAPHSWTYLDDTAATLLAAASYRGDWGRAWHVPCSEARSCRAIARDLSESYGVTAKVAAWAPSTLRLLAAFSPMLRAVRESSYMFESPFVIDATETERELGVSATPWNQALAATVEGYRSPSGR